MILKRISGIAFALAMIFALSLFLDISIPFFSRIVLIYLVLILGIIGVVINLINVRHSKHSITYSIIYWVACLLLVLGIGMRALFWTYSSYLLYAGAGLMLVSFFLPKYEKEQKDDELLDDFQNWERIGYDNSTTGRANLFGIYISSLCLFRNKY